MKTSVALRKLAAELFTAIKSMAALAELGTHGLRVVIVVDYY